MKRFIGGKYVDINENPNPAKAAAVKEDAPVPAADAPEEAADAAAKNAVPAFKGDISKAALELMSVQHPGIDWSGLKGTGRGGQVTKTDVQKFLGARG